MVPVARRNLFSEKGRFAISVAGVAFAVGGTAGERQG